ncbi:MAG: GNAT family N-acetyltransferase [Chloroflexota bacterium]|nr:GNAT family N-acetyltransferase [Chloroflexota bacterium]
MSSLRPMTHDEFDRFRAASMESYAHERARNLGTSVEEERAQAARQYAQILPNGFQTEGHLFWKLVADNGDAVGDLWVYREADSSHAFLFVIEIAEEHRGKGRGKRALQLIESQLRPAGVSRIGLNVFADNDIARSLYEQAGYRVTNLNMQKHI